MKWNRLSIIHYNDRMRNRGSESNDVLLHQHLIELALYCCYGLLSKLCVCVYIYIYIFVWTLNVSRVSLVLFVFVIM